MTTTHGAGVRAEAEGGGLGPHGGHVAGATRIGGVPAILLNHVQHPRGVEEAAGAAGAAAQVAGAGAGRQLPSSHGTPVAGPAVVGVEGSGRHAHVGLVELASGQPCRTFSQSPPSHSGARPPGVAAVAVGTGARSQTADVGVVKGVGVAAALSGRIAARVLRAHRGGVRPRPR